MKYIIYVTFVAFVAFICGNALGRGELGAVLLGYNHI